MNNQNRTYLVDTSILSPDEVSKVKKLLDDSCWMYVPLSKRPYVFIAHTNLTASEFASIQFPVGCALNDVTGHDLFAYL